MATEVYDSTLANTPARLDAGAIERRTATPVKWWAGLGAAFLAFQAYLYGSWILSGEATPTPTGADPLPDWMRVGITSLEVFSVLATVAFLWFFLIRPWRTEGRLTLDGIFCLAGASLYWMDPLFNYVQNWTAYNSGFVNLGNWSTQVPGWNAPNSNLLPEALLLDGPLYIYAVVGGVFLANKLMRWGQRRWPRLGTAGVLFGLWSFMLIFEFFVEGAFLLLGAWTYPGAIEELTLFHGNYFQFPIYEIVLWGTTWTALAAIRFFRNDKGQTIFERGADRLRGSRRRKAGVRLLAAVGAFNITMLCLYLVPITLISVNADEWPADWDDRSYLRNGVCGEGTDYACSGPSVPIPRGEGSARVNPEGDLVPAPE